MPVRVGTKGQVVIEKEIRDALGIEPGALAVQRLVGDHVEIRFLPAEHERSLRGRLRERAHRTIPPGGWHGAVEEAWQDVALREEGGEDGE